MKSFTILLLLPLLLPLSLLAQRYQGFQAGDLIFQTSRSSQSEAIRLATDSKWSHVGMVMPGQNGDWVVWEAVQPVKVTPLQAWIDRGENHHFEVRRLKNASEDLKAEDLEKMKSLFSKWKGKDYDWQFGWSDETMYCSELVWKLYFFGADQRIGEPKALKYYRIGDPKVAAIAEKRWGHKLPLEELMVAPQTLYESNLLEAVVIQHLR